MADTAYVEGTTCELVLETVRDAMELTDANLKLLEKVNEIFENIQLNLFLFFKIFFFIIKFPDH